MTTEESGRPFSKQEILHFFKELKPVAPTLREAHARVAYYGWRLKSALAWNELGYEDEDAMRMALEIPESTWYAYIKIGSQLRHLKLEELQAIRPRNLQLLTNVTIEQWPEHDWVSEAKKLEPNDLADLITTRNRENGVNKEPMTHYRVKVPFSSQKMIETTVKSFQERHELSSPGRALELLIADQWDRPSYLVSVVKVYHRLAKLKELLDAKGIIDEEVHELLKDIRMECSEVYEAALSKARTMPSGEDQGRRRGAAAESRRQDGAEEAEVGRLEEPERHLSSLQ